MSIREQHRSRKPPVSHSRRIAEYHCVREQGTDVSRLSILSIGGIWVGGPEGGNCIVERGKGSTSEESGTCLPEVG